MNIIFCGVRGSQPMAQEGFLRYGGETTSVLVHGQKGEWLAIDAGTGMRRLAQHIGTRRRQLRLPVLITHYHLDHTAGLPICPFLYDPRVTIEIAGPRRAGWTPARVFSTLLAPVFWPVSVRRVPARLRFRTLPAAGTPFRHGGLSVRWCTLHHEGGCTAYRIQEPGTGASFVFATDVEWQASSAAERRALLRLCAEPTPAGLLIFDGHFTPREYARFRDWGHSTWRDAAAVAGESGIRRLCITHHDPHKSDRDLARLERGLRKDLPHAFLAREGMEVRP